MPPAPNSFKATTTSPEFGALSRVAVIVDTPESSVIEVLSTERDTTGGELAPSLSFTVIVTCWGVSASLPFTTVEISTIIVSSGSTSLSSVVVIIIFLDLLAESNIV